MVVQSEVPHEQGAELIETPFVVVHGAAFRHEFMDAVQNMPVVEVQSVVPHLQSVPAVLAVIPLVTTHGQVMSSLSALETYVPVGHTLQELSAENPAASSKNGFDMKEPLGQHPNRASLFDPRFKDSHLPPHSVLLNPLA